MKLIRALLILVVFAAASFPSKAETITTELLLEATVDCLDCVEWQPVGVCVWMTCYLYNCDFDYSIRFKNYVPDFAVTSYSHEKTPFEEMQEIVNDSKLFSFAAGFATVPGKHVDHLRFKKTEVWGNPGVMLFEELYDSSEGFICKSGVTAYKPYYLWAMDYIGWHMNIPDMFDPKSYTSQNVIGSNTVRFGNVYPRCGWSIHPEDPKAAALSAHRAGFIVTDTSTSTRVRIEPETDCGDMCWPAEEIIENDISTHKWQMLIPKYQTKGEVFGSKSGWSNLKYDTEEQYAWLLWRPYSCCTREGAILLFSIDVTENGGEFNPDELGDKGDELGDFEFSFDVDGGP